MDRVHDQAQDHLLASVIGRLWPLDRQEEVEVQGQGLRPVLARLDDDAFVGTQGYLEAETLRVVRRQDGTVSHLECATFVYTRTPYDPDVDIPGGHQHRDR